MAIFNSYVSLPEGNQKVSFALHMDKSTAHGPCVFFEKKHECTSLCPHFENLEHEKN